ncbi:NAD-dependent deacylase [Corynebacterium genitalium ATCC 33030]|uniref:NAD-dependent protein deacylase n=1 Tax=Corynebacterium genitalium ATCC 33030 TaxID=585529 RepID=D7WBM2_9CORY|nr:MULTISPECIES: NAD-dependent deacylase [Corynebacterium]EFK55253.1 transcriptional regulator, Sir2 family [Corynebacterium genitalium ATCC 33030]MCQ4624448.1 NAD-dependent deacylase [Corynebacterium sp. CCUG 69979]UUA89492.1 NAD-dependent deacylase [Corynebacterium genitalium ATCC 33030]
MDGLEYARQLVGDAKRVEVFTGAGMSADSGIATYRDAVTGVWENVDPQAMASIDAWARDPEPMWAWYLWRARLASRAEPNAGHLAIAEWGRREGVRVTVTTQNIDNLHERAVLVNSTPDGPNNPDDIVHLHGSLFEFRCSICSRPYKGEIELPEEPVEKLTPPSCPLCGNLVRPGVVWFGEPLPPKEWDEAERRMVEADLVVIVGTSGVVFPAAGLPLLAHELGTPIIEVTPMHTELSRISNVTLVDTAAKALPELLRGPRLD